MSLSFSAPLRRNNPKRNALIISGGASFSIAISKTAKTFGWGVNNRGQLANNTVTEQYTPKSIAGAVKTFCQISAGTQHAMAIDKNGRAWGWGYGNYGQLGNNASVGSVLTPVSVLGAIKTFCQISSGPNHTVAIDKSGRIWCWGINQYGQLGDNSVVSKRTPVSILGAVKTFCKIAANDSNFGTTIAIDKNGRVWGWGRNDFGNIGDNSITCKLTPVSVLGAVKTFCEIDVGFYHTMAIDKNGRLWGWGYNRYGQLGNNGTGSQRTPVSVLGGVKTFCEISAGGNFSLAITKDGRAWGWGYNSVGNIGDGTLIQRNTPVSVAGTIRTFCQISVGTQHSLAVDKNGRSWGWGLNSFGQIGNNVIANKCTPASITGATKTFCEISSDFHTTAIDKNGRVWSWGRNAQFGSAGDGTNTIMRKTPVSVVGAVKTFCKIAASIGGGTTLSIDKNGRAWGWGYNSIGQIGDGTQTGRCTPVSVAGAVKTFCLITVGSAHSGAIDKNGILWTWGLNNTQQLGTGNFSNRFTPGNIAGTVKTFCAISFGESHCLSIEKNGQVWAWGRNTNQQTGTGGGVNVATPTKIGGLAKTFCKIDAGRLTSVAIDKNGRAWGWGYNGFGSIGDNSVTQRVTPVSVLGAVKTFCEISTGSNHTLAIDKNGRLWGWGYNTRGQLGDNSTTSRRTPVSVAGAVKTFCKISAGYTHSVAIDKNGRVWAWGFNIFGQNADGLSCVVETPVQICSI